MKKLFLAATGLLLTAVFSLSFAQDYAYHNPFPKNNLVPFMVNEDGAEKTMNTVSIDANYKLQKSFNRLFKNAGNVNWYNVKKDYLAVFDYEGRKMRALFTKNGFSIYTIAYGAEKDLPKWYRKDLKYSYDDFDILNAVEIQSSAVEHTTWLALLKDEDHIVIARIINGDIDEYARYNTKPKEPKKQRKGRIIIPKTNGK